MTTKGQPMSDDKFAEEANRLALQDMKSAQLRFAARVEHEQPMSDTLPEREDQMNDKRETAIQLILSEVQQGYTIDEAVKRIINRHCRQDRVATTTTTNTHQNPTVWHDCCKGYDHAPWCAAYKEVDKCLHNGHSREVDGTGRVLGCSDCRSEHEPAARGGGDAGWRLSTEAMNAFVKGKLSNDGMPVFAIDVPDKEDRIHYAKIVVCGDQKLAQQIIDWSNQHQSLVAERERLRRMLAAVINAKCNNGPPLTEEQVSEIARWWQSELQRNKQRSTSE